MEWIWTPRSSHVAPAQERISEESWKSLKVATGADKPWVSSISKLWILPTAASTDGLCTCRCTCVSLLRP